MHVKRKPRLTVRIVLLVFLMVVPLNLTALISALGFFRHYTQQTRAGLQNLADVFMTTVDNQTERADLFLYNLVSHNQDLASLLKEEKGSPAYENARYHLYTTLYDQLSQENMIIGYFLIPPTGDRILSARVFFQGRQEMEGVLANLSGCDNRWHVLRTRSGPVLMRIALSKGIYVGAVVDLFSREKELMELVDYDSAQVHFYEVGIPLRPDAEDYREIPGRVGAKARSGRCDLCLSLDVSQKESFRAISLWNLLLLIVAFLFLGAAPVIYVYLKRHVVHDLSSLNQGFERIEEGDRTYLLTKEADTLEFQEAFYSFNRMVESMEDLRLDIMEKELEKKQMELDNLKLQIRPHFLMNTLNLMYFLLRSPEGMEKCRGLILYLSDYFRYLMRNDSDMEPFDKELSLIEGYVESALLRYPGGLSIRFEIDPQVRLALVPPLLIHNFIENVVKHALKVGECVHIVLRASLGQEEQRAVFVISDDGIGMNREQVELLNRGSWKEMGGEHVGIRNALRRLDALYEGKAKVVFDSRIGEGTVVTISIPAKMEGGIDQ